MNEYIDSLIFDRAQSDIDSLTAKAYISHTDLNRVERAIAWASKNLNIYGYKNKISKNCKVNWKPEDRRTDAQMERIRQNMIALRAVYFTPPSTPMTPQKITYTSIYQANAVEKILYDLGKLVENCSPGQQHLSFRLGSGPIGNRGEI